MKPSPDTIKTQTLNLPKEWDALFDETRPPNSFTAAELFKAKGTGQTLKSFREYLCQKTKAGKLTVIRGKLNHRATNFYVLKPH